MSQQTRKLTTIALLTALSAVLIALVHFPLFPAASFLQYDPADVPILIGAFAYGPAAALGITVLASFIQAFFLGGDGLYGFLMHVIASGILAGVAGTVYRLRHTRAGGAIALCAGTAAMGLVMMVANHFITPHFMGVPASAVDGMLLPVILPFNLLKAGINSGITFVVYKTVSRYVIHGEDWKKPAPSPWQKRKDSKSGPRKTAVLFIAIFASNPNKIKLMFCSPVDKYPPGC